MKLGRLEVTVTGARVEMVGRIDDASPLGELWMQLPATDLAIDTGGVTFVNSVGMREWIRLLRSLTGGGTRTVTLERVADVLITQMNLIPSLGPNIRIASFHAQYACNGCGAEVAPLVDAVQHAALLRQLKAPSVPCPECGSGMELADFPERYLTLFKA
jgi:DNA-directed RNA polymerase subunit RPC12/RpoP